MQEDCKFEASLSNLVSQNEIKNVVGCGSVVESLWVQSAVLGKKAINKQKYTILHNFSKETLDFNECLLFPNVHVQSDDQPFLY